MIFTWTISASAFKFNCMTARSKDMAAISVESSVTNPLTDRYFSHENFSDGIRVILEKLKINRPDFYNGVRNTFEFPLNWIFSKSFDQSNIVKVIDYVNGVFSASKFPVSFKNTQVSSIRFSDDIQASFFNETSKEEIFNTFGVKSSTTMNVFMISVPEQEGGMAGMGAIPGYKDQNWDGVFFNTHLNYDIQKFGNVVIHEFGHFFGLYHTFEGGCGGDGDWVKDTAPADGAVRYKTGDSFKWQCDSNQATCGKSENRDLIENFMDYTNCSSSFTEEQKFRMMNFVYYKALGKFPKFE